VSNRRFYCGLCERWHGEDPTCAAQRPRDWRDDVAEDIHAMRHARSWSAVESIRRSMQGLGRWTGDAQRAYAEAATRFGHEPVSDHTNGSHDA
jgi:hypothetical protein